MHMQADMEAMKAVVQAKSETAGPAKRTNGAAVAASMITRRSGPSLKQTSFN